MICCGVAFRDWTKVYNAQHGLQNAEVLFKQHSVQNDVDWKM